MATSVRNRDRERRWAIWRTRAIGLFSDAMLIRTRIVQTPWFGVYLHRHLRPDSYRELHDHPWSLVSLILRPEAFLADGALAPHLLVRCRAFTPCTGCGVPAEYRPDTPVGVPA